MKFILSLVFLCNFSFAYASTGPINWFSYDDQKNVTLQVDLFLSDTCPHCHKADAFFREIEKKMPWLDVHRYVINQDKLALQTFYERLQQQNSMNFSVPAIMFCDSRWAGFADEKSTGKALLDALSYCHQKIIQQGELSRDTINVIQKWGAASQIETSSRLTQSAWQFISITALSDALNPCALFCLAAFFAFLWLYPKQRWVQFYVGLSFILSQGIVHYVQQAYSAIYYQSTPGLHWVAMLIGLLLLFFVIKEYRNEKSRIAMNTGILLFAVVILTGFVVHIYQQTCEVNLVLVFERWLIDQPISSVGRVFYQVSYQLIYLLPLFLLWLFYFLFSQREWMTRHLQVLKIAAYLILASVGIILLAYPVVLANVWASVVVFFGAITVGWWTLRSREA